MLPGVRELRVVVCTILRAMARMIVLSRLLLFHSSWIVYPQIVVKPSQPVRYSQFAFSRSNSLSLRSAGASIGLLRISEL